MKRETRRYFRELAFYASLGFAVSLSIVIGLALGIIVDRYVFHTPPWGTLTGLGLGIAAAYRNIALVLKRSRNW